MMKKLLKVSIYSILFLIGFPLIIILASAPFNGVTEAKQNYFDSTILNYGLDDSKIKLNEVLELKIMTYNIADAHGFTTNGKERVEAIAKRLIDLGVDIVGIQEAFIKSDRELLYNIVSQSELKYHVEYPAATLGNGIIILSKFPIEEHYFHRFVANNAWYKVWEGDWWVGKGVGLARVRLENGALIDFYNTHAQAYRGNQESHDVRYQQFVEASNFIEQSTLKSVPAFFVGDFNTEVDRPDYLFAKSALGLNRLMNKYSRIDHITALANEYYDFEVLDTQVIEGRTMGAHAGQFYSRAVTPLEFWALHFGEPEETALSDHKGYMSTIRISPQI